MMRQTQTRLTEPVTVKTDKKDKERHTNEKRQPRTDKKRERLTEKGQEKED